MTNATLRGKSDAGNPHVRFDEGEVASAKPRRGSLLYKNLLFCLGAFGAALIAFGAVGDAVDTAVFDRITALQVAGARGNEPVANVAVLVRLSASVIDYSEFAADGSDLRFVSAVGKLLAHEIDVWNPSGTSLIWVNVPSLTSAGAVLRLCHSPKEGATLPTVNAADVWKDQYAGVWHLNDTGTAIVDAAGKVADGSLKDSTRVGDAGIIGTAVMTSTETEKNSKVGGISIPMPAITGNKLTVSGWFKHNPDATGYYYDHLLYNKGASSGGEGGFATELNSAGTGIRIYGKNGTPMCETTSFETNKMDVWTHMAVVYDGAPTVDGVSVDNVALYINGTLAARGRADTFSANTKLPFAIGNNSYFGDISFKGWADEVRMSATAESPEAVSTRYAAMANTGFARVLKTIDRTQFNSRTPVNVGLTKGCDVANVPVLVRLSTAMPGFSYERFAADGSDVRFADAADHLLPFELVKWDTAGESQFWVMLPAALAGGTTFYLYHDAKDDATLPTIDTVDMWKSGYTGVWHFEEAADATSAIKDATGQIADGEIKETEVTKLAQDGKFGRSVLISDGGKNDKPGGVFIPDFKHGNTFTVSGWFKHTDQDIYYDHMFGSKYISNSQEGGFAVEMDYNDSNMRIFGYGNAPMATINMWKSGTFKNTWAHMTVVYEGTNVTLYVNGESRGTKPIDAAREGNRPLVIGNANTPDISWKGWVDEVRIAPVAESSIDVAVKYAAMADTTFVTLGDREALGEGSAVYSLNVGYDGRLQGRFAPEDYEANVGNATRLLSYATSVAAYQVEHPVSLDVSRIGVYTTSLSWTFPGLQAGKTYGIRLYFYEGTYTASGNRIVDIYANGTKVAEGIDYNTVCGSTKGSVGETTAQGVAAADGTLTVEVKATKDNAQVQAIEIVDPTGDGTPIKPLLERVTVTEKGTHVSISSQTGLTRYEIRRRTAGGAYETVATDRQQDSLLLGEMGTDWLYSVRGVADGKVGAWSDEVSARAIDTAGAPTSWAGVYVPSSSSATYTDSQKHTWRHYSKYPNSGITYSSGATSASMTAWLDVPYQVLCGLGYKTYMVCLTNLLPATHYTLRLHTGEAYHSAHAKRQSYSAINGDVWEYLPQNIGVDYYAYYGKNRFNTETYETISDHLGRINIRSWSIVDNAQFAAIEVIRATTDASAGAVLTARNAQTNKKEREILSTTVSAMAFDWTTAQPEGADESGNEIVLAGEVTVTETDTFTFTIEQNGNGFLYVDDVPLAIKWGSGAQTASASRELCAGTHTIRYRVNQQGGVAKGAVYWQNASGTVPRQLVGAPYLTQPAALALPAKDGHEKWRVRHIGTYRQGVDVYPIGTAPDNGSTRYRMVSTGNDYWDGNEHCPLFSQKVRGDGSLTVRLINFQHLRKPYTSFGLNMRTTDGNMNWDWQLANYVETSSALGPDIGMGLRIRGDVDASDGRKVSNLVQVSSAEINMPLWLRMVRTGTKVESLWSRDGETWTSMGEKTVAVADEIYIGVMALANAAGSPEYTFDSLTSTFTDTGLMVILK